MDMVAHGLWTAVALSLARRRFEISPSAARATVVASVAPDVLHALPLLVWALLAGQGALGLLSDWTFDGLAWNRPDVLISTYLMLALTWAWLAHGARRS